MIAGQNLFNGLPAHTGSTEQDTILQRMGPVEAAGTVLVRLPYWLDAVDETGSPTDSFHCAILLNTSEQRTE